MQISQPTYEFLFLIAFFTAMGGLVWIPTLWSLLTFFTPKKLLDTYFKEPHFTQTELIFMSRFPISLFRTAVFGWIVVLPFLDRVRKIRHCHEVMPIWYKLALQIFIISSMLIMAIFLGILFFLLSVNIA
ncbi:hypothetical protein CYL31_17965 [Marinomonas sp. A3A]|uniref:hypothetical protein n=1 Tax=Marinomonas sp. A3A TaxID=2065312 RepID=UPI001BB40FC9|nr:hypothetical protein [Marinomonas sp. A3A]QUX93165.1 hypothetical protein CYL31_17965 [Marinomonas sp. A3A]